MVENEDTNVDEDPSRRVDRRRAPQTSPQHWASERMLLPSDGMAGAGLQMALENFGLSFVRERHAQREAGWWRAQSGANQSLPQFPVKQGIYREFS
jgi:hypothetical protein